MTTGPQRKETLCKYYLHGACNKGESCSFSHERSKSPLNSVCTHWLKGNCAFGDKCRYEHRREDWCKKDKDQSNSGYKPPTVPKPKADALSEQAPITQLRLGGAAVSRSSPNPPPRLSSKSPGKQPRTSPESALKAVQAQERRSPPPFDLPTDLIDEPSTNGNYHSFIGEQRVQSIEDALPDDLDLSEALHKTTLQVDPELLAATAKQEEMERELSLHASGSGGQLADEHYFNQNDTAAEQHYYRSSDSGYGGGENVGYYNGDVDRQQYADGNVELAGEYYPQNEMNGEFLGVDEEYYYDENGLPIDEEQYFHQGGSAYGGSFGGHSSNGDYNGTNGTFGSTGTSPGMASAWHIPSTASSDGGWNGAYDPAAKFYASPALQSLCWEYYNSGYCSSADRCQLAHGEWCETCSHYALHPADQSAREAHLKECRARHGRLEAIRKSAHVECGICYEKVVEKHNPSERRFGLLNCDHPFCLGCIRNWRQQQGVDVEQALRTCPTCRVTTHFITPSTIWPSTPEEKESIINGYKSKLADIDCRHFNFGEGQCPFGTSCMYKHAYADGRLEEAAPRRVAANEGEIKVVQPVRLSDFIVIRQGRVRGGSRR